MKEFFKWLNPNIKMKRWLIAIFIGAVIFGYAISNLLIKSEITLGALIITIVLFVLGASLIIISFMFAQSKTLELVTGVNTIAESLNNNELARLFKDKNLYEKNPKVCIIGTGIGVSSIIESAKKYSNNISVLTPFYENDIKNSIISLSTNTDLMKHLFENGYMLKQIESFKNEFGNYEEGLNKLSSILSLNGNVIPLTFDDISYKVKLSDGIELSSNNDDIAKINVERGTSIKELFLENSCKLTENAKLAIRKADIIIFAPCKLYSELIPMLKIDDLYKLCKKAKAKIVYFNNIVTVSGETTFYDVFDHIQAIYDNTEKNFINYCVCDKGNISFKRIVEEYDNSTTEPVKYNKDKFEESKIKVYYKDLAIIDTNNDIVYNSKKVSNVLADILSNNKK